MKLILKTVKPRNPFVAASLRRNAGAHRSGAGARRQQAELAVRKEVSHLEGRHRPATP
jgi:hypothetical protein